MLHLTSAVDSTTIYTVRRIEEFKNEKIIPHIVREEALEGNFVKYLYAQDVLYPKEIYSLIDVNDK